MWIVKIPKHYRTNDSMARYVGPFNTSEEASDWVASTFVDSQNHLFKYVRVDAP